MHLLESLSATALCPCPCLVFPVCLRDLSVSSCSILSIVIPRRKPSWRPTNLSLPWAGVPSYFVSMFSFATPAWTRCSKLPQSTLVPRLLPSYLGLLQFSVLIGPLRRLDSSCSYLLLGSSLAGISPNHASDSCIHDKGGFTCISLIAR